MRDVDEGAERRLRAQHGNVSSEQNRQQVITLGRLPWPLRRIERETGARRETASTYLKAAGIEVRRQRGRRLEPKAAPTEPVELSGRPAVRAVIPTTTGAEAQADEGKEPIVRDPEVGGRSRRPATTITVDVNHAPR